MHWQSFAFYLSILGVLAIRLHRRCGMGTAVLDF